MKIRDLPLDDVLAVEPPLTDEESAKFKFIEEPAVVQISDWGCDFSPEARPALVQACLSRYPSQVGDLDKALRYLTAQPMDILREIKAAIDAVREFWETLTEDQQHYLPRIHNYLSRKQYLLPPAKIFWSAPQAKSPPAVPTEDQKKRQHEADARFSDVRRREEEAAAFERRKWDARAAWRNSDPATRPAIPPFASEEEIIFYGGVIEA